MTEGKKFEEWGGEGLGGSIPFFHGYQEILFFIFFDNHFVSEGETTRKILKTQYTVGSIIYDKSKKFSSKD
jgi:hypothetical protein